MNNMETKTVKIPKGLHYIYSVYCSIHNINLQDYITKVLARDNNIKAIKKIKLK